MQKVMMTWASGDAFCNSAGFRLYMKTAKTVMVDYDKFVFTNDMSEANAQMIEAEGFRIIRYPNAHFIMRDRHRAFYEFLRNNCRYSFAVVTDCRDVLFQKDPTTGLRNEHAYLVSEGFCHKSSGFNSIEQFEFQRNVAEFKIDMSDKMVLNGGTMFGNPDLLSQLFLNLWFLGVKTVGRCTDQAALNYWWQHVKGDGRYRFVEPQYCNTCLTGEGVKVLEELGQPLQIEFDEVIGKIRNQHGDFAVVHQWDRLSFAPKLLQFYGLSDMMQDSKEGADEKP